MDKTEKSGCPGRVERFLTGSGFYAVLALCGVVIFASAWFLWGSPGETALPADPPGEQAAQALSPGPEGELIPRYETQPRPDPPAEEEPARPAPEETAPAELTAPVAGELVNPWSGEALAYSRTLADWRVHDGVDLAAEQGALVMAAADGVVEQVLDGELYGTTVILSHAGGLRTHYANLAPVPTVSPGDAVTRGEVLGAVGDTALAESGEVSHLHFAVTRNGAAEDPLGFFTPGA